MIVRTPVCDGFAWRTYGVDWVQLDAPRHLFIPTRAGMQRIAGRAGMRVVQSFDDSSAFQFWGSEQYRRGVPLHDPRSYADNPATDLFTDDQIRAWEQCASALNRARDGDSTCFVLRSTNACSA